MNIPGDGQRKGAGSAASDLRDRIRAGGCVPLDELSEHELEAMQQLVLGDEAEIVNSACRPYLVAKLDRVILPP